MVSKKTGDNSFGQAILNSLEANICLLDEKGNIEFTNALWFDFAKENDAEIEKISEGCNYLEVCDNVEGDDKEIAKQVATGIRSVIAGRKDKFEQEYPCHSPSQERWFSARVTPYQDLENNFIRKVVVYHVDITKRKQAEKILKQTKTLLKGLFESIQDGISVLNTDLTIRYTNNTIKIWHESDLPLEGKKCYQVYHKQNLPCDPCPSLRCLETGKVEREEINPQTDIGSRWFEIYSYPLFEEGAEEPTGVVELVRDITERKKAEEKIEYLSFYDSLTGLYNRDYIEEEMERLDTKRQLPISLIMADLNGLKLVNDTYGHYIGDEMLKKSAEILQQSTRKEDIVARWGGDEFVIFLPQTSEEEADNICKRINDACKDVYIKEVPISISVGVSTKNDLNKSLEKVIIEAEDEMYNTKLADSQGTKKAILDTLMGALVAKGIETEKHIEIMEEAALKIGEKIELLESDLKRLSQLVKLHDIGKINIPEGILTKLEPLTSEEWEVVKEHPQIGYRIARSTEEFAHVAEEILSHHERWDGKGYPQGLKGKEIPLLARIIAVAGAYEKIINKEYGSENVSYDVIEKELNKRARNSLDPELVDAFIKIIKNDGKD